MKDGLEAAKKALDMYREPNPDDKWDYVEQYAKLSVLISIAESLKILADKPVEKGEGKEVTANG